MKKREDMYLREKSNKFVGSVWSFGLKLPVKQGNDFLLITLIKI